LLRGVSLTGKAQCVTGEPLLYTNGDSAAMGTKGEMNECEKDESV